MRWLLVCCFLTPPVLGFCQNESAEDEIGNFLSELADFEEELDSLIRDDSMAFFGLLESIINPKNHELSPRIAYSSNVTTTGRDFGINQTGYSAGLSYAHTSGLFADIYGNWFTDQDPKFASTIMTVGYIGIINNKWSYMASYDHVFFNTNSEIITEDSLLLDPSDNPFNNSLNFSIDYDIFNFLNAGVNYTFQFGEETANSIFLNIGGDLKSTKLNPFRKVSFSPTFTVLFGDESVIQYNFPNDVRLVQRFNTLFQRVSERRGQRFALRNVDKIRELVLALSIREEEENRFGLLNYSFSFPLTFYIEDFTLTAIYTYNIPQDLQNSDMTFNSQFEGDLNDFTNELNSSGVDLINPTGYFTLVLSYPFRF